MKNHKILQLVTSVVLTVTGLLVTGSQQAEATPSPHHPVTAVTGSMVLESWGDNSAGELGTGSLRPTAKPVEVSGLSGVKSFSAGDRFDLALMINGTVEAWGSNVFGQLGDGNRTYSALPVQVEGLSGVVAVSAGGGHSLALLSNGTIMAWGDNQDGQLGDGSEKDSDVPVAVVALTGVQAISAGSSHSMALLANGTVETWGYNDDAQLGDGNLENSDVPVGVKGLTGVTQISAGGYYCMALTAGGKVWTWGYGPASGTRRPAMLSGVGKVKQVSAGWYYALAMKVGGSVVGWSLGTGEQAVQISGVADIAAGGQYGTALLKNGSVEAWGDDALNQLGSNGDSGTGSPVRVTGLKRIVAISAGANSSLALSSSGSGSSVKSPSPHPSIWQDVPSPNPNAPNPPQLSDTSFKAVSAASSTDAWAVGEESPGTTNQAIAVHWDGSGWTAAKLPTVAGSSLFESVVDLSPGDAWAVGSVTGTDGEGSSRTLIEHWNGAQWAVVSSPNPAGGKDGVNQLTAVTGKGQDVWALGEWFPDAAGAGIYSLYLHLVDGSWRVVKGPNATNFYTSATEISSDDVWAVGFSGGQVTSSVHWDGKSWRKIFTPFLTDGRSSENFLTGISASGPSDIWASGAEENVNDENLRIPYVLHNNGSGWTLVKVPTLGGEGSTLNGITILSPVDVWAVGQTQENDGSILTLSEQFNGKSWSIKPSLDPGSLGPLVDSGLDGITSAGTSDLLSVGFQETLGRCCVVTLSLTSSRG